MDEATSGAGPTRTFWVIACIALLWNLIGIATYLGTVTMGPETIEAMTEAERALYANVPAWATSAYAIAVFSGTIGCIGLLLRRAWAVPVLVISLVSILVQMGHALFMTPVLEVQGAGAAILPVLIIIIAAYLVWFSTGAKRDGLLA